MLFTVLKDKESRMSTNSVSCIYDENTLNLLHKAGFKFKLNGKSATVAKVVEYCKTNAKK